MFGIRICLDFLFPGGSVPVTCSLDRCVSVLSFAHHFLGCSGPAPCCSGDGASGRFRGLSESAMRVGSISAIVPRLEPSGSPLAWGDRVVWVGKLVGSVFTV
jgi:hypothetical protein